MSEKLGGWGIFFDSHCTLYAVICSYLQLLSECQAMLLESWAHCGKVHCCGAVIKEVIRCVAFCSRSQFVRENILMA